MDITWWWENFGAAGLLIAGIGMGWTLCVKILVTPEKERLAKAEEKLERMSQRIEEAFWSRG